MKQLVWPTSQGQYESHKVLRRMASDPASKLYTISLKILDNQAMNYQKLTIRIRDVREQFCFVMGISGTVANSLAHFPLFILRTFAGYDLIWVLVLNEYSEFCTASFFFLVKWRGVH